jgi:AcrR family transcriptional regulator
MDPEADRLILETTKRLMKELGYARLTIDAVAKQAGVARTTIYRRYQDKGDLVSAAIESLRGPEEPSDSGDTRRDLIAHVELACRHFDMSLAGTLLMEKLHDPRLLDMFRERMVLPRAQQVRGVLERGVERGDIGSDVDLGAAVDLMLGALFWAVLAGGAPDPAWPGRVVDALWAGLSRK